jgi:hypothetical protein
MKNALLLAACYGLLVVTPQTRADILLPGQSVTPPAQQGSLGAPPNVASIPFTPFSFDGVNGMYREFVFAGRNANPFGGLSFEYQFTLPANSGSTGVVQAFTANGFAGWETNVTFAPGGAVPASEADRSAGLGDVINFTLANGGVGLGVTSEWLIVDTNAPTFAPNTVTFSNATGGVSEPALGPTPIPEPGTLPLASLSLLLAGAAVGYRRLTRPRPSVA